MKLSSLIMMTLLAAVFLSLYSRADAEVVLLAVFVLVISILPIAFDYERREETRRELSQLRTLLEEVQRILKK